MKSKMLVIVILIGTLVLTSCGSLNANEDTVEFLDSNNVKETSDQTQIDVSSQNSSLEEKIINANPITKEDYDKDHTHIIASYEDILVISENLSNNEFMSALFGWEDPIDYKQYSLEEKEDQNGRMTRTYRNSEGKPIGWEAVELIDMVKYNYHFPQESMGKIEITRIGSMESSYISRVYTTDLDNDRIAQFAFDFEENDANCRIRVAEAKQEGSYDGIRVYITGIYINEEHYEIGDLVIDKRYLNNGLFDETYYTYQDGDVYKQEKKYDKETGLISYHKHMKNDILDGQWDHYNEEGLLLKTANYADGILQGEQSEYSTSGSGIKLVFAEYFNDKKEGKYIESYENGQVSIEGQYSNDLESGEWLEYNENGVLQSQINYEAGKLHGYHGIHRTTTDNTGEGTHNKMIGNYLQGKKHGEFTMYYNEKIINITYYENDVRQWAKIGHEIRYYDEEGVEEVRVEILEEDIEEVVVEEEVVDEVSEEVEETVKEPTTKLFGRLFNSDFANDVESIKQISEEKQKQLTRVISFYKEASANKLIILNLMDFDGNDLGSYGPIMTDENGYFEFEYTNPQVMAYDLFVIMPLGNFPEGELAGPSIGIKDWVHTGGTDNSVILQLEVETVEITSDEDALYLAEHGIDLEDLYIFSTETPRFISRESSDKGFVNGFIYANSYMHAILVERFYEEVLAYELPASKEKPLLIYHNANRVMPKGIGGNYDHVANYINLTDYLSEWNGMRDIGTAIYHEFSHKVMYDSYGNRYPKSVEEDWLIGTYGNQSTASSLTEGFAYFMQNAISEYYGGYGLIDQSPVYGHIEPDFPAWFEGGLHEARAVSGVLYDLYDQGSNDDKISIDLKELVKLILEAPLDSVGQLYDKLILTYPSQKEGIDGIFIAHGFFSVSEAEIEEAGVYHVGEAFIDSNKNFKYDKGETVIHFNGIEEDGFRFQEYKEGAKIGYAAYSGNEARQMQMSDPKFRIKTNSNIPVFSYDITFEDASYMNYSGEVLNRDGYIQMPLLPYNHKMRVSVYPVNQWSEDIEFTMSSADIKLNYANIMEQGYIGEWDLEDHIETLDYLPPLISIFNNDIPEEEIDDLEEDIQEEDLEEDNQEEDLEEDNQEEDLQEDNQEEDLQEDNQEEDVNEAIVTDPESDVLSDQETEKSETYDAPQETDKEKKQELEEENLDLDDNMKKILMIGIIGFIFVVGITYIIFKLIKIRKK